MQTHYILTFLVTLVHSEQMVEHKKVCFMQDYKEATYKTCFTLYQIQQGKYTSFPCSFLSTCTRAKSKGSNKEKCQTCALSPGTAQTWELALASEKPCATSHLSQVLIVVAYISHVSDN